MNNCRCPKYLVITVIVLWLGSYSVYAQETLNTLITLDTTTSTVRQLLDQLEAKQQFRLAYSESYLDVRKSVRLFNKAPTVKEVLDVISQATNTIYQVKGNQIIFRKKGAKFTISGYIRDVGSGEDLIGASVWQGASKSDQTDSPRATRGSSSNNYGFYSLTLPADTVRLRCSYVGHASQVSTFVLYQDTVINWDLSDEMLAEVTITSAATGFSEYRPHDTPVSIVDLLTIPTLLGEVDILKGLQRLPGVQAGTDGSAGLYVRGSSPDHNLLLLDGVPVYNASHLFGFFSVFNADAVNSVGFYKGAFPARYGGRLASVVDVQLKEGNREAFQGAGSVGLLASRLTLEGPLLGNKTSFLASGRYGHPGPITRLIKALGSADGFLYSFYDLTAKLNHTFSHQDQVYMSAYLGNDRLGNEYQYSTSGFNPNEEIREGAEENFRWGNLTTALRWNHVYNRRLFSNLTLTYSRYHFRLHEFETIETQRPSLPSTNSYYTKRRRSEIYDQAVKVDFDYFPNPYHHVRFGSSMIRHTFRPNTIGLSYQQDELPVIDTTYGAHLRYGTEGDLYAEDEINLTPAITVNIGLRVAGFWVDGASYLRGQPRASVQYQPTNATTWQASYTRMAQFMHLLANPSVNLPTDQWLPTTRLLAPETAQQWTLGYQRSLGSSYAIQAETYYKTMRNIVEYKEGGFELYDAVLDWENNIVSGRGRSYGVELLAQRTSGRLTGWLGYTLARSERQFNEINDGRWFPFKYDRRHDIDFGGIFHWKKHIDVSWGWGFASGFAFTLPTVVFTEVVPAYIPGYGYSYDDRQRLVFGERNGQRSRATHRLDVSISFRKAKRWGERTWEFGVYNVYSRRNPFSVNYFRGYDERPTFRFYQTSLFPVLPMVSYRFTF